MSRYGKVFAIGLSLLISASVGTYAFTSRAEQQRLLNVQSDLQQIALALQNYAQHHHGRLPPAVIDDGDGRPLFSWRVLLLPYLENIHLYEQFKLDEPWDSPHNRRLLASMPRVYGEPNSKQATHYRVFGGTGTAFDDKEGVLMSCGSFLDGYVHTVLVIESQEAVPWTKPEWLPYAPDAPLPKLGKPGAKKFAAVSAAAIAGSFATDVDAARLRAAITRNGGERTGLAAVDGTPLPPGTAAVTDLVRCVCSKDCEALEKHVDAAQKDSTTTAAAVRALLPATVDIDSEISSRAETVIGAFGVAAVDPLIDALPELDPRLRESVVRLLVSPGPKAAPRLMAHLKHAEPLVREVAARALGAIEPFPEAAIPPLMEQLADAEPGPRVAAIRSLSQADWATMLPVLTVAFDDERVLMRRNAVVVTGYFRDDAAPVVPRLVKLMNDKEAFVRQEVASTLGAIGSAAIDAVPALEAALKDPDSEVRGAAQYALEHIK